MEVGKTTEGASVEGPGKRFVCRGDDRRRRPTPMLSRWLFVGRRRAGRREGERLFVYVDRPGGWVIAAFLVLLGLSILDAAFTLSLLRMGVGAEEANPAMKAALHLGDSPFVLIKTAVTAVAAGFLCLHKNWPLGRGCLVAALLGYSALTAYHLYAHATVG
jgi:hypothetical protein